MGPAVPPGQPGAAQPEDDDKDEDKDASRIKVTATDKTYLQFTLHFIMDNQSFEKMKSIAQLVMSGLRGELDLAGGDFNRHDLAAAVKRLPEKDQRFPRGALKRDVPSGRLGARPWEPNDRQSWMVELLPFLGEETLYAHLQANRQASWKDPVNWAAAATVVPQFQDPSYPAGSRYVRYPGIPVRAATTHFVGISGVGPDAAEFPPGHPAAGIFGYDRETALKELKESKDGKGLSSTILMAQVPPLYGSPWLAGGGSTVRGVPETGSVRPFVSVQANGQRGTYVLMADGSVRFIGENVSDSVFKALATIKGNLPEDAALDTVAPPVAPPKKAAPTPAAPAGAGAEKKPETPAAPMPEKKPETPADKAAPPAKP
jgi:hypothetical protein